MLFLDSAVLDDARAAAAMPFVGGMSCNPTLLARALGTDRVTRDALREHLRALAAVLPGSLFVQVLAPDADGMVADARWIRESVAPERAIVKIPYTLEGLRAVRRLASDGVPTCVTAIYTPLQAYASATSGAAWIAPYCSRITRAGGDGVAAVGEMVDGFRAHGLDCRLLVASVKTADEVQDVLRTGATHVTVPLSLLQAVLEHQGTRRAVDQFAADLRWEEASQP